VTELEPGKIRIVTKGHGHGFGLSQYTAQKMAEKGEDYRNILQYFFPGTELENVE
jgi:stage II sporulation protein D